MHEFRVGAALVILSVGLGICAPGAAAQGAPERRGAVRAFVDCQSRFCDFDYFRSEIQFVDYVRTRQAADVHVLVTTQETGGGGTAFTLRFIGRGAFAGLNNTLTYAAPSVDTRAEVRQELVHIIKGGLIAYASRTPAFDRIEIGYAPPEEAAVTEPEEDPWNYWTFRTGFGGFFRGEQRTRSTSLRASVAANRTTEVWKIDVGLGGRLSESRFEINDSTTVTNDQRSYEADALVVRSLTDHWSAGVRASAGAATFFNRDLSVEVKPAIEYNLFPYTQANRRQLTVLYAIGINYFNYEEQILFGFTAETRLHQSLAVSLDLEQPWGSVSVTLRGSNYFYDLNKNRLELFASIDLQLIEGLALNVFGGASRIRDQLYLPAGDLSPEDILLRRRQLATSYDYFFSVGLSYTFGSIYNNVVNPRFE